MPQYPIPQFIEEEGKIISFLTFRQFFYLVGGGAVCFFFYFILPSSIFILVAIATMGLAVALAFVKINNSTIVSVVLNFIGFSIQEKTYTWKKKESTRLFAATKNDYQVNDMQGTYTKQAETSRLRNVKTVVDTKK